MTSRILPEYNRVPKRFENEVFFKQGFFFSNSSGTCTGVDPQL